MMAQSYMGKSFMRKNEQQTVWARADLGKLTTPKRCNEKSKKEPANLKIKPSRPHITSAIRFYSHRNIFYKKVMENTVYCQFLTIYLRIFFTAIVLLFRRLLRAKCRTWVLYLMPYKPAHILNFGYYNL